jgi:uncharacterized protein involved in type VI secretion and phage assembly/uncharacterized Zn-binding protein involved in type VI secretion
MNHRSELNLLPFSANSQATLIEMHMHEDYNGSTETTLLCYTESVTLKAQDLLGKECYGWVTQGSENKRYFGGLIDTIITHPDTSTLSHQHFYTITLTSPIAQLRHTKKSRSFMRKSARDIIQELLMVYPYLIIDFSKCKKTYLPIDYIVQYNQSDFSFIQVLCAEYGLFYRTSVDASSSSPRLKMTFGDDVLSYRHYAPIFHYAVNYYALNDTSIYSNPIFNIHVRCKGVANEFRGDDYNPMDANADLSQYAKSRPYEKKSTGLVDVYPLNIQKFDPQKTLIQSLAYRHTQTKKVWEFQSTDALVTLGYVIETQKRLSLGSITVMPNLLLPITIVHEASDYSQLAKLKIKPPFSILPSPEEAQKQVSSYHNTITAIEFSLIYPYIPLLDESHKAILPTTLSGVVVGRPTCLGQNSQPNTSTNLAVDSMDQVSVAMHWDFSNPSMDYSLAPRMRIVSRQNGLRHLPHVGDEVMVACVDNRPDRFVILGAAYNSKAKPPLKIGKNPALAGIKTANEKGAMPHYFYGDQTKDAERLVMHSSNNYIEKVGNTMDRDLSTYRKTITESFAQFVKGDMSIDVKDDSLTISAHEAIIFEVGNSRIELLPDRVNLFGDVVELETMLGLSGHLVTVGSAHTCPEHNSDDSPHQGGPVTSGSSNVFINDIPVARVGDVASCHGPSDTITAGNASILINGQPAAIVGSPTAHGGTVTSGVPTVIAQQNASLGEWLDILNKNYAIQMRMQLAFSSQQGQVITHAMINLNNKNSNEKSHLNHPTNQLHGRSIVPGVKGGQYDLQLAPQDRELAIYSVNGKAQFPYYKATITIPESSNPDDSTIRQDRQFECKVLWPIMVLNCRVPQKQEDGTMSNPEDSLEKSVDHTLENPLDPLDIKYFKNNGNNVTVFIHGYNVEPGELGVEYASGKTMSEWDDFWYCFSAENSMPMDTKENELDLDYYKLGMSYLDSTPYKSSIVRDMTILCKQLNQPYPENYDSVTNSDFEDTMLNGSGAFNWFLHMEKNLNEASGMNFQHSEDFEKYTRLLHVTWSGDLGDPNYIEAVDEAFTLKPAAKLANALAQLKQSGLEVNIIAHSLGNGFLLRAMKVLAETYPGVMIDHVFMWDAAVPNNVFNRPKPKNNTYDRWDFKNTLNAMQKLTVLHSYNDNVLGPFAKGDQQKAKIEDVYKAKPANEWFEAYICDLFQLESLYLIAMGLEIDTGVLLTLNGQEKGYKHLLSFHPDLISQSDTIDQMRSDFKNGYYMPTLDQHMSQVYSSNHYSALTHQVKQGFKKLHEDIHEPSSALNQYLLLHPDTKESMQPILDNVDEIYLDNQAKDDDGINTNDWMKGSIEIVSSESMPIVYAIDNPEEGIDTVYDIHEAGEGIATGYDIHELGGSTNWSAIWDGIKLASTSEGRHKLMRAMYLVNMLTDKRINERFVPAMGYAPLDKPPSYFKGKVNYVNQTQWLFEHSGMRIPSKDLMTNIYQAKVMNKAQGIKHFGLYEYS